MAMHMGYDNTRIGATDGTKVTIHFLFGIDNYDVINGEMLYIYVDEHDYDRFKQSATPDAEYKTGNGETIFIYKA